jgi:hypothetical protein
MVGRLFENRSEDAATLPPEVASYSSRLDPLYAGAADRSKMMSMAGCLPKTKRFRHGRPDRGRY